jgi:CHASE3 domain sensor protein
MEKQLFDLFIFVMVLCVIYYVFSYMNNVSNIEGLTNNDSTTQTSSSNNGIAGNAASYSASIKNMSILTKDKLLISKYRADYENIILSYDDYVNSLMLEKLLDGSKDQMKKLSDIATLNQSKTALNAIMKFVDSQ